LAIVPLLFLTWMSLLMTRLWVSKVYSKKHRCQPCSVLAAAAQSADQSNHHMMTCFDLPCEGTWLSETMHHQKFFD